MYFLCNITNVFYLNLPFVNPCFRILALEKLGAVFNQISTPLKYTPRKFAIDPSSGCLIVIETDHNALTETAKQDRKQQIAEVKYFSMLFCVMPRIFVICGCIVSWPGIK